MKQKLFLLYCLIAAIPLCDAFSQSTPSTYIYKGTTFYYNYLFHDRMYSWDNDDFGYYDYDYPVYISPSCTLVSGTNKLSGDVELPDQIKIKGYVYHVTPSTPSNSWTSQSNSSSVNSYSYTSKEIGANESTVTRIYFATSGSVKFTVVSNGENNYDYLTIGEMDSPCTRSSYKYTLMGKSGTPQSYSYTPTDSKLHYVEFCYSKDSSQDSGTDNATIYVSAIDGLTADVTEVEGEVFSGCSNLKSLVIPATVTQIGKNAESWRDYELFNGCTNLSSVTISDSNKDLTIIGNQAETFADCPLTDLYIGRNVKFGKGCYCDNFDRDYDDGPYNYAISPINKTLTNLTIGGNAQNVKVDCIFSNEITNLYISTDVAVWCSFCNYFNDYAGPVEHLGDRYKKEYCNNMLSHTQNLFMNGVLTTDLVIPEGVTNINDYAFYGAKMLQSVSLPSTLTAIGEFAFYGCENLSTVQNNSSLPIAAGTEYYGYVANYAQNVSGGNYIEDGDWKGILSDGTAILYQYCGTATSVTIPETLNGYTVSGIHAGLFSGCESIKELTIPSAETPLICDGGIGINGDEVKLNLSRSLTGSSPFDSCRFKEVNISGNIRLGRECFNNTTIGTLNFTCDVSLDYLCFHNCNIEVANIPEGIATLPDDCFSRCDFETLILPSTLESVECIDDVVVKNLIYRAQPTLALNFINSYSRKTLETLVLGEKVTKIGSRTLNSFTSLKSIAFEGAPTSIESDAFAKNTALESVDVSDLAAWAKVSFANANANPITIAKNLTLKGEPATEITVGGEMKTISNYAFNDCETIKKITIADDAESIGSSALTGMNLDELIIESNKSFGGTQLSGIAKNVTVSENITELPSYSISGVETLKFNAARCTTTNGNFANKSSLKNVYVGDAVQMLPDNICSNSSNLESVVLGNSVKLIGTNAFNNCSNIKTINARGTVPPNCLSHFPVQVYMDAELVVPGEALNTYRTAPTWSTFFNITTHDEIVEPDVMTMERPNITLDINDKTQIVVYLGSTIIPSNSLTWTSSDNNVATVTHTGMVTAIASGHATITATNADGESVACEVNVKESQFANLDDYLRISNVETSRFASFNIPVYLENKSEITAFQCDIYMPEGVNIKKNSRGNYAFTFGSRTDLMCHVMSSAQLEDGAVRLICYSTNNYAFAGNEGLLFNIPVEVGGNTGSFEYSIRNITFSTTDSKQIDPIDVKSNITIRTATEGDANGDEIVNVIDVTTTVAYILGGSPESFVLDAADIDHNSVINVNDVTSIVNLILHPAMASKAPSMRKVSMKKSQGNPVNEFVVNETKVAVGETTMVPVYMSNESPIFGYQCDIHLPSGMTLAVNDKGQFAFAHGNRSDDHTLNSSQVSDGVYRLISYSPSNTLYDGNSGILFYVPVKVDENLQAGDYTMSITEIVLSEEGNKQIDAQNVSCKLVPDVKKKDVITWDYDFSDYEYEDAMPISASALSGLDVTINEDIVILEGAEDAAELTYSKRKGYQLTVYEDCYLQITASTEGDEEYSATAVTQKFRFQDGKYVPESTEAVDVTIGVSGYATLYYGEKNLVMPEGVVATTYGFDMESITLTEIARYQAGDVIPAGTGVLLHAAQQTEATTYQFEVDNNSMMTPANLCMFGVDEAPSSDISEEGCMYYVFNSRGTHGAGFYWASDDGKSIEKDMISAHKAYLKIPSRIANAKAFFSVDDYITSISLCMEDNEDEAIYSISGLRMQNAHNGVFIKKGKKYHIK